MKPESVIEIVLDLEAVRGGVNSSKTVDILTRLNKLTNEDGGNNEFAKIPKQLEISDPLRTVEAVSLVDSEREYEHGCGGGGSGSGAHVVVVKATVAIFVTERVTPAPVRLSAAEADARAKRRGSRRGNRRGSAGQTSKKSGQPSPSLSQNESCVQ